MMVDYDWNLTHFKTVKFVYFLKKFRVEGFTRTFFNGPFLASFSLFSYFQYTVDSKQMFNI